MFSWLLEEFLWQTAWPAFYCLCLVVCRIEKRHNEANSEHVVWRSSPLWSFLWAICLLLASAVSFIKPQTATWSGQTQNLFTWLRRKTNSSLCVCAWVCVDVGGRKGRWGWVRESWWVCHLWIWRSKLIFGPASSSLWTENRKPTDSWDKNTKKREREIMCFFFVFF